MGGYEEDVVEGDRADEVKEEPGPHVVPGDQLRIQDHLLAVVRLHYPCAYCPYHPQNSTRPTQPKMQYFFTFLSHLSKLSTLGFEYEATMVVTLGSGWD